MKKKISPVFLVISMLSFYFYSSHSMADKDFCNTYEDSKSNWKKIDFSNSNFNWSLQQRGYAVGDKNEKNFFEALSTKSSEEKTKLNKILEQGVELGPVKCNLELFQDIDNCPSPVIGNSGQIARHITEKLVIKCDLHEFFLEIEDAFCSQPIGIKANWDNVADETELKVVGKKANKFEYKIQAFCRLKQ